MSGEDLFRRKKLNLDGMGKGCSMVDLVNILETSWSKGDFVRLMSSVCGSEDEVSVCGCLSSFAFLSSTVSKSEFGTEFRIATKMFLLW